MKGYYKDVVAILKKSDYQKRRQGSGAHEIWSNGDISVTVSKNMKSRHTANEVMKRAGISHKF
ncbi:type II toxin-antitoxin system HicA family toxin [Candidatus Spongiihabitans sp.]|uniref:type II toxin-antitoxin system HicA family toxin n=1 Tax=Candidatus Spongiihabitans sp. TaxID=3101308 RepID=UPI003C7CD845